MSWLVVLIYFIAFEDSHIQEIEASKGEIHTDRNPPTSKCNPDDFEFGNHCYFLEKHSINGKWNISAAMTICHSHNIEAQNMPKNEKLCNFTPTARGMAVETHEELNFIKDKLMTISGDQWKALTSGYLACQSKSNIKINNANNCGKWYEWDSTINNTILGIKACSQYGFRDACGPEENALIYFVLKKELGKIIWDMWIPNVSIPNLWNNQSINGINFFTPPTHIVCEYETYNGRSCSTNTTNTASTQTTSKMSRGTLHENSTADENSSTKESEIAVADNSTNSTTEAVADNSTNSTTEAVADNSTNSTTEAIADYSTNSTTEDSDYCTTETTEEDTTIPATTGGNNESSTTPNACILCTQQDTYGQVWKACAGTKALSKCPDGAEGKCSWECDESGSSFIGKTPDYSQCHSHWIDSLLTSNATASDKANGFQQATSNGAYFGHEIIPILNALKNVTDQLRKELKNNVTNDTSDPNTPVIQVCKNFMTSMGSTTNNLIKDKYTWDQLSDVNRAKSGNKIQEFLNELGMSLANLTAYQLPSFELPYSSLYVGLDISMASLKTKVSFPMEGPRDNGSITIFGESKEPESKFIIAGIGNIIPNNYGKQIFPQIYKSWSYAKTILNTAVISYSYNTMPQERHYHSHRKLGEDTTPLTIRSVEVVLPHSIPARGPTSETIRRNLFYGEERTAVIGSSKCVFWNENIGLSGEWDGTGCKVESTNETHTKCVCTHLSSFAVFMTLHEYKDKGYIMDLLTWICSGSSIISLTITIIIFHLLRQKLPGERETICRNISACLLITHILALSVLDKRYFNMPDPLCSFMGAVLHYALSASIMWMAAEGHYLYRSILHVMDATGKDRRNLYRVISYGLPAVIIAATALIGLALGDNAYGNPEICWLSLPNYQWVFIIQALIMTGANTIVLILALKATLSATPIRGKTRRRKIWIWIRGWFTLASLLGVSWFIGLLSFDSSLYIEYIFVVFNGSQGVLIFTTRVLRNRQIRKIILNIVKNHEAIKGLRFRATMATGKSNSAGATSTTRVSQSFSDQALSSVNESIPSYSIPDPSEKREDNSHRAMPNIHDTNPKINPGHLNNQGSSVTDSDVPNLKIPRISCSFSDDKRNEENESETVNSNQIYKFDSMKVSYSKKSIQKGPQELEFMTELKAHLKKYSARLRPFDESSSTEGKGN